MISSSAAPASPLGCGLARSAGVELDVVVRKMRVRVCQIAGRTGGGNWRQPGFRPHGAGAREHRCQPPVFLADH